MSKIPYKKVKRWRKLPIQNILLSYSRSANTWLRYCIEFLVKKPTWCRHNPHGICLPIGSVIDIGVDLECNPIINKSHGLGTSFDYEKKNVTKDTKMIFILRNYKDVIPRHTSGTSEGWSEGKKDGKRILRDNYMEKTYGQLKNEEDDYIDCLNQYDSWDGEKLLINYEDILGDLKTVLTKVLEFLGEGGLENLDDFINNIDKHRQDSFKIYGDSWLNATKVKPIDLMSQEERIQIDDFIKKNYPVLFEKYLSGYEEK